MDTQGRGLSACQARTPINTQGTGRYDVRQPGKAKAERGTVFYVHVWGVDESGAHHGVDCEMPFNSRIIDVVNAFCRHHSMPLESCCLELPPDDGMPDGVLPNNTPISSLQRYFEGAGYEAWVMEFVAQPAKYERAERGDSLRGHGPDAGRRSPRTGPTSAFAR